MRIAAILTFALLIATLAAGGARADRRVALVIGNGDYQYADKLPNPVTDANRMRNALERLGFEVIYGEDLALQPLQRAIGRFADAVQDADVALVYFAGHGATFGDVPYVVPVDARFSSLGSVPYELVPVETLIGELRRGRAKGLRVAILDACRDNAAERELKRASARGGETTRGLARVKNPEGLILAYATQYLDTAADGDPRGDSPFTGALLRNIATPGLDVKELFFNVGREVIDATNGKQRPEISVSFYDRYALIPTDTALANPPRAPTAPPPPMGGPFVPLSLPPPPPPRQEPQSNYWNHNGSRMRLVAQGASRQFFYVVPRAVMVAVNVRPGTLLFDGRRDGDRYSGTAYIFSAQCGPAPYQVTGTVSADDRQVTMYGRKPRKDANCQITHYVDDTLVFTFQGE